MLRALRKLLRPGGRIAYTTIHVADGLSAAQRQRARRSGPPAVASRSGPRQLLVSAGFVDVELLDITQEFAKTARGWIDGRDANASELIAQDSAAIFAERQRGGRAQLRAIEDGLLKRALLSGARP